LKRDASDPLNLRLAVAHGVHGASFAVSAFNGPRLPKIQSSQQLPHDEDICPPDDLFAQRRARSERRIIDRGTKIRESAKFLPQAEQSRFRTKFARILIIRRTADGPEQHGLGSKAGLNRGLRQGIAELRQSGAANFFFVKLQVVAKTTRHFFQYANRLRRNFRTNSVTGERRDAELHGALADFPNNK